jgi:hypothetical protein
MDFKFWAFMIITPASQYEGLNFLCNRNPMQLLSPSKMPARHYLPTSDLPTVEEIESDFGEL